MGVGLWSYKFRGGDLTFSHITVSEGTRILGEGWYPYTLLVLLTLKQLSAIGAPILPRLASRPFNSVCGIFPLLGAFSAGNLSMLWWDRFMKGGNEKLTDHIGFARTVFALVLAWIILGLWAAVRGLDLLSERFGRRALKRP